MSKYLFNSFHCGKVVHIRKGRINLRKNRVSWKGYKGGKRFQKVKNAGRNSGLKLQSLMNFNKSDTVEKK